MSVRNPYSTKDKSKIKEEMAHNRSTLYDFFNNSELFYSYTMINKRKYTVFQIPYIWENSYLMINDMRITDFQSVILFTNELVVRFSKYDDWQINIPYKSIKTIGVTNDLELGYQQLHLNK